MGVRGLVGVHIAGSMRSCRSTQGDLKSSTTHEYKIFIQLQSGQFVKLVLYMTGV